MIIFFLAAQSLDQNPFLIEVPTLLKMLTSVNKIPDFVQAVIYTLPRQPIGVGLKVFLTLRQYRKMKID